MKKKLLVSLMLLVSAIGNVFAGGSYGIAEVAEGGHGYVYSSSEDLNIDSIGSRNWSNTCIAWIYAPSEGTPYWVYAKPMVGFEFTSWSDGSTDIKHQKNYFANDTTVYANFSLKKGYHALSGVPSVFSVYMNGDSLSLIDGKYYIEEGARVKIVNGTNCGLTDAKILVGPDSLYTLEPEEHDDSITFQMPETDAELIGTLLLNNTSAGYDLYDILNNKCTLSRWKVKMMSDIYIGASWAEYSDYPFSGVFDGNGYTVHVNFFSQDDYTALFCYVNNATIKNLTVDGKSSTEGQYSAGLVGRVYGDVTIDSCVVTTSMYQSSYNPESYLGGIVGYVGKSDAITIKNTIFAGSIEDEYHSDTIMDIDIDKANVGGIIGYSSASSENVTLVNCLEKGNYTNIASMHPVGFLEYDTYDTNVTNCYYVNEKFGFAEDDNYGKTDQGAVRAHKVYGIDNANTNSTTKVSIAKGSEYGVQYKDTVYAGANEEISLSLSNESEWYDGNRGYKFTYSASLGTLTGDAITGYTLAMADDTDNKTYSVEISNAETDIAQVAIFDNADNRSVITNDFTGDVWLKDRTLYKDGKWNTICLPFDVDLTDENSPLFGATARTLVNAYVDGTTLHLEFGDEVETMEAGVPYLIKWDADVNNITTPVFVGVTMTQTMPGIKTFTKDGIEVSFVGTYSPVALETNTTRNLYLGANNKLLWPDANVTLGACRAYFKIGEVLCAKGITGFVIDFGEDDEVATGVNEAAADSLLFTPHSSLSEWHTVSGIRLSGKPSKKGMYIYKGKTVVVE